MKKFAGLLTAGLVAATLTACNDKEAKSDATKAQAPANDTVYLYTWTEYVPDGLLDDFTKETGIKVIVASLESNETMYAKMKTQGDAGGYDVIAPSNYFVSKMAREGMLQELDHSKLPVIKELDPDWLNKPYDKGNKYSLPQLLGAPGIAFNTNLHFFIWDKKYLSNGSFFNELDIFANVFSKSPEITVSYESNLDISSNLSTYSVKWK